MIEMDDGLPISIGENHWPKPSLAQYRPPGKHPALKYLGEPTFRIGRLVVLGQQRRQIPNPWSFMRGKRSKST
jgi:hypothetical protein